MGRKKKEKDAQFFADSEKGATANTNKAEENAAAKDAGTASKTSSVAKPTPEQIEREYGDILNYQRKQRDNLLGNFSTGEYQIPEAIKAELLKIPKKFGEMEGNVARLSTILGRFVLNFKIVFQMDPDVCNAKLYIIEIEHNLDEDIKHETLLEELEQTRSFEFRKTVFEKWHVFYDDDVLVKDELLHNYLHMQHEENLFFGELDMILSQLFVVRMLAFLDKMGELGDKIRVDFKLAMEKWLAKNPKYAQNFVFQKRLLDKFIAMHGALVVIAKTEEGAKILLGYSTPLKNVRDKTYPSAVVEPKKKEEKKSEKKAQPTIKKKSGSPAKKADAKSFKFDPSKVGKLGINFGGGGAPRPISPAPRPRTRTLQTPTPPTPPRVQASQIQTPQTEISTPPKPASPQKDGNEVGWSKLIGSETVERGRINSNVNKDIGGKALKSPDIDLTNIELEEKNEEKKTLPDLGVAEDKNIGDAKPKENKLELNF